MAATHPPQWMQTDEPEAAEQARRRITPRRSFLSLFARNSNAPPLPEDQSSPSESVNAHPAITSLAVPETTESVNLDGSAALPNDDTKDIYRWAIIYENQRGLTLFSTAYYSRLGLLPCDPPAFTLLDANPAHHLFASKSHQPSLTLSSYPLPDGNWHWVSKSWMVDMRGDDQVQYDGFEYNWHFRKSKWRSDIGNLSTGAWVRRRRWVRLMVKPAKPPAHKPHAPSRLTTPLSSPALSHTPQRRSATPSSHPPSVFDPISEDAPVPPFFIWEGDVQDDWLRCHDYLRTLSRDGKKLEVWRQWLGLVSQQETRPMRKQRSQDEAPMPSEIQGPDNLTSQDIVPPPIDFVITVVRAHMDEILQSFVYPDSRAQFLLLLGNAGVLPEVQVDGVISSSDATRSLNFWSYTADLGNNKGKRVDLRGNL
jgi:hypothetical protein